MPVVAGGVRLPVQVTPAAPAAGTLLYTKAGGGIYYRDAGGAEVGPLGASGGGGGAGDVTLAGAQTFSGVKTFPAGTLLMRNAADTESNEPYSDSNPPESLEMTDRLDTPPATTTGVVLFSRKRGGRSMLAALGPSGLDTALQPFLASNSVAWMRPVGNGTVISVNGFVATAIGPASASNWANTNLISSLKRLGYPSAATVGAVGGVKSNVLQFWRGNGPGLGGFQFVCRFGLSAIPATSQVFCGLYGSTTNPAAATVFSTNINLIGVGKDTADTNLQFMVRGTGGTTKVDTGIVPTLNDVYEVRVFAPPNGSDVMMSVERLNGGTAVEFDLSDVGGTANLPAATQGLLPMLWASNVTTAAIIRPELVGLYVETDY